MRYQAPIHTSSISAPTRDIPVGEDGIIELGDDAPEVEHDYLRRAGCELLADEVHKGKPVKAPSASGEEPAARTEQNDLKA